MSVIKRLSTTLFSRIDGVVSEIENHDAVVQANLKDMRRKIAEARVRLNRVHHEEEKLARQVDELKVRAERWRARAIETAASDEQKALECVSRSRYCDQQVERCEQARLQYQRTAEKLARDIEFSEQRLDSIRQKLTLMRARQSTSSALSATSGTDEEAAQMLEDTFDRWEINISQAEMAIDSQPEIDPIEREFTIREREEELRNELNAMLEQEEKQ